MPRRPMIERHLALAEERVTFAVNAVERQQRVVEHLKDLGADSADASELLENLQRMWDAFIANRDRLRQELAEMRN